MTTAAQIPADQLAALANADTQRLAARMAQDVFAGVFRQAAVADAAPDVGLLGEVAAHCFDWCRAADSDEARALRLAGYDIESRIHGSGKLRFIEVKGRVSGAPTITVTRNEILRSLNKPRTLSSPSSSSSMQKRTRCITCVSRSAASRILASPASITTLPIYWRAPRRRDESAQLESYALPL